MANTSAIPMTVDGVRLDTYAWNIETLTGRMSMPAVRGGNAQVPGRHGSIWTPNKTFDDSAIKLAMWINGCDVDGGIPGGSSQLAELRKNADSLTRLFGKRSGLLDVRQTWPGGVRQILCEVVQAFDMSARAVGPMGKFNVILEAPDVFWRDVSTSDYASATGLASGVSLTLAPYAGATAPIEDGIFVVRGPATNPRIMDNASGTWVQLNGTIAAGTDWQVDAGNWTSRTGSGILFTVGGGTNAIATTSYGGGAPRFISLSASDTGPGITLTGSGFGSGTQVQVRARRKFFL